MRKHVPVYIFLILFVASACSNKTTGILTPANERPTQHQQSIVWNQSTLHRIAPQKNRTVGYCGYPRMIQLHNNSLLCVYEVSGGNIESTKSFDNGSNWSAPVVVATRQNGINMAVPEILELKDESLLVSYNPRPQPIDTAHHFAIRTKKSYDGGLT